LFPSRPMDVDGFGDALFFQPDAQYVIHPGGTDLIGDAFVAGLQAGVNL